MTAYNRDMSTKTSTRPTTSASSPNPTEGGKAPTVSGAAAPSTHVYGVHTQRPLGPHPMPIYLGAQNTPASAPTGRAPASAHDRAPLETEGGSPSSPHRPGSQLPAHRHPETEGGQPHPIQAYNPAALLRHLVLLWALLLGLTLWLGGWQPHTSSALLGWSTGTISVVEGTDGDTGARILSPNDEGVLPAPDTLPVDTVYSPTPDGGQPHPVDRWGTFFEGSGPGGASVTPWSGGCAA